MKRDVELVRTILRTIEELDEEQSREFCILAEVFPSIPLETLDGHLTILSEAGLIEVKKRGAGANGSVATHAMLRLKWEGHDFIAAAKNESVWKKMLAALKENGYGEAANAPFALIKSLLMNIAIGG